MVYYLSSFFPSFPFYNSPSDQIAGLSLPGFVLGGFLVGFGTKLGNGCTSGHGVCGLPRFSKRSWVFIICMMISAMTVANAPKLQIFKQEDDQYLIEDQSLFFAKLIALLGMVMLNCWFIYLIISQNMN